MKSLLARLLGGVSPTGRALRTAHENAERARLSAINRDPPPGNGWRLAPQDSEGKWTVWNGPRPVASFWDENEAAEWARQMNRDPRPNPVDREDGKYCVNCGSRQTDESLKARGYVSCCPERYVIPEEWHVSADRLATGQFHLWRPAFGLDSMETTTGFVDREEAKHEANHRNLLAHRPHAAMAPTTPEMADVVEAIQNSPEPYVARALHDAKAEALATFIDVPIPDGVRAVVGPHRSPADGNWWVFDRGGPVRGYTRKTNAQLAADRINNAPQT